MNNGFSIVEQNGVKLIRVDCINRTGKYRAYYSTGYGGISDMPGQCSMNLAMFKACVNDRFDNVKQNFRIFADACGFSLSSMALHREVHGNHIAVVQKSTLPSDVFDRSQYGEADGQITRDPDVALFVYAADCATIMIVDSVHEVSGVVHCGWRNSVNGTIHQFINEYCKLGGSLSNAIVAIGPSISSEYYSVDQETADLFHEKLFSEFLQFSPGLGRWKIDLPSIDKQLLIREGLSDEQIFIAPWCTYKATDIRLPSYRRDHGLNAVLGGVLYHVTTKDC